MIINQYHSYLIQNFILQQIFIVIIIVFFINELIDKIYIIKFNDYQEFRLKLHCNYINLGIKYNIFEISHYCNYNNDRKFNIDNKYKEIINNYCNIINKYRRILDKNNNDDIKKIYYVNK